MELSFSIRVPQEPGAAQGHLDFYRLRIKKQELKKRVYDESEIDKCDNCHVHKIL